MREQLAAKDVELAVRMERVAVTPALLLALLIAFAYSADRTALSSQVAHLSSQVAQYEAERESLHSRVELMEQAFNAPLAQPSAEAALPERRGIETVPNHTGPPCASQHSLEVSSN